MGDDGAAVLAACRLLDVTRRLRACEREYLAGRLHDGPIQDLAAAALELSAARTGPAAGDELAVPVNLVESAGRSLRALLDELWLAPQHGLAAALTRRTGWLLAAPLCVDADQAGLMAAEIPVVADVVELILLGAVSAEAPARAMVAVRTGQELIVLELNITPADESDQPFDPAAIRAWLDGLAAAMQIGADVDVHGRRVRVRMGIPRRSAKAVRDVTERLELQAERERLRRQAERDRLESQLQQSQRLESLGQLAGGWATTSTTCSPSSRTTPRSSARR